jgi:hypothetical protein
MLRGLVMLTDESTPSVGQLALEVLVEGLRTRRKGLCGLGIKCLCVGSLFIGPEAAPVCRESGEGAKERVEIGQLCLRETDLTAKTIRHRRLCCRNLIG